MADKPTSDDPRRGAFMKRYKWEPSWEFMDWYIRGQAGDKGTRAGAVSAIVAEVIHSWRSRVGGGNAARRRAVEVAADYDESSVQDVAIIQELIKWSGTGHQIRVLEVLRAVQRECQDKQLAES